MQRNKFAAMQMSADYRGDTYSLSATVGNPDILNNSGIFNIFFGFIFANNRHTLLNRN